MKDRIYRQAPYFVKVILLNIIALLNYKKRKTTGYALYLKKYLDQWHLDVENIQKDELKNLLKEVYTYSSYYQKILIIKT